MMSLVFFLSLSLLRLRLLLLLFGISRREYLALFDTPLLAIVHYAPHETHAHTLTRFHFAYKSIFAFEFQIAENESTINSIQKVKSSIIPLLALPCNPLAQKENALHKQSDRIVHMQIIHISYMYITHEPNKTDKKKPHRQRKLNRTAAYFLRKKKNEISSLFYLMFSLLSPSLCVAFVHHLFHLGLTKARFNEYECIVMFWLTKSAEKKKEFIAPSSVS